MLSLTDRAGSETDAAAAVIDDEVPAGTVGVGHDDAVVCEPPRLKILVAEDDAGDFALIERALTHMSRLEPQITSVATLAAARFCLASDDFDVVLADWGLGPDCGCDLIEATDGQCPVIIVSGALSSARKSEALARGAAAAIDKRDLDEVVIQSTLLRILLDRVDDASGLEESTAPTRPRTLEGMAAGT